MTPLLALTADWHLASGAWRSKGVLGDSYYSLEQVVDYCVVHQIPLIGAGDLYDTDDPDPGSVAFAHAQLDRMAEARCWVFFIVGQHERHRCGSRWLATHRWAESLDGSFDNTVGAGVWVYGIDWTPATKLPERLLEIPVETTLLVMHQVCKELMQINHEVVLSDIPGDCKILIGDYHVAQIFQAGSHTVISPGSFCMQSIDEAPNKSFVVMDDEHNLHTIPLKTRQVGHFRVHTQDDLDRLLADRPWEALLNAEGLPAELQKPLVSVTFPDDLPMVGRRLADVLEQVVHYFPMPLDSKRLRKVEEAETNVARVHDLVGALDATVPNDALWYAPLRRLLDANSKSVGQELAAMKEEFTKAWKPDGCDGQG